MFINEINIRIPVGNELVSLKIIGLENAYETLFEINELEAFENAEARIQLLEGHFYEYIISDHYALEASEVVNPSRINASSGRLGPNIYTGTLAIDILNPAKGKCAIIKLEVRSKKASYRHDYRFMLEGITEKCTDLLLEHSSPVTHHFTPDFKQDSRTMYQRFSFIRSILESEEFGNAVQKIVANPVTAWARTEGMKDIRNLKKMGSKVGRQIAGSGNRIFLPDAHLQKNRLKSVPVRIYVDAKKQSPDTAENRFVKHVLQTFCAFIGDFRQRARKGSRLYDEAVLLETRLDLMLGHAMFRDVEKPVVLALNSPVLQRKPGYKEVLKVWLMFDLAARLIWRGGDDVYEAGKKDVAALYEYWLFFQLLELVRKVFSIEPASIDNLIKPTRDGLGLQLKQGKHIAVNGVFDGDSRKLNVEFSFNRSFSGKNDYPQAGSWTTGMRPDYTLSIWPAGVSQMQAETDELIVHIHFDAKYKIETVAAIFGEETKTIDSADVTAQSPDYRHDDLLKMHSYKDAIRRTAGAYVLYPGSAEKPYKWKGFHELIPGLGAFAVRPSRVNSGVEDLRSFLDDVIRHFLNRASQREKVAFRNYDIYNSPQTDEVREVLPETFGENRDLIPDDTFVLVGFYKNEKQLAWIRRNELYNFRTGTDSGSLSLGAREVNARYLLLHGPGEKVTGKLFKMKETGPRIFSKQDLIRKKYPSPKGDLYIVYRIDLQVDPEFRTQRWDISKLSQYKTNRASGIPFSVSLTELMKVLVKE
ncbi:DUF2357 domain-containing protein [Dyadobacter bucti]|uniref:DUF2357 domain-containing protein n=1 Tax=Dyadobacter bucti TaxID=2572203 RepID=UPI003F70C027